MVDARGYLCPMPVVMVQKALEAEHPDTLEVLVDNETAVETSSALPLTAAIRPQPSRTAKITA